MNSEFDKNAFGKRLKEIRKSKKLTQDEICDKANIDVSNYSKMETGKIMPSLSSFYKIVNGADVDANEFFQTEHLCDDAVLDEKIKAIYDKYSIEQKRFFCINLCVRLKNLKVLKL